MEVVAEARSGATDAAGDGSGRAGEASDAGGAWRAGAGAVLFGAGAAALLVALGGAALARHSTGTCLRRDCGPHHACEPHPHTQLYTTEPSKRNGKALSPPDGKLDRREATRERHSLE